MTAKDNTAIWLLLLSCCFAQVVCARNGEGNAKAAPSRNPILGYWQNVDDLRHYLAFEAERFVQATAGNELEALPVSEYADSCIVIPALGQAMSQRITMNYTLMDGSLRVEKHPLLKSGAVDQELYLNFKKLPQKPPVLQIRPLAMGKARILSHETTGKLCDSLYERMVRDQTTRQSGSYDKSAARAQVADSRWLKDTVTEYGWIDMTRFGERATLAAFLIAQHCFDMRLRLAAQSGLEKDLRKGKPVQGMYSWLYDRNSLYCNGYQRYGTHFRTTSSGDTEILPLEDINRVDYWRKKIRLASFSAYIESLRNGDPGRKVVVMKSVKKQRAPANKPYAGDGPQPRLIREPTTRRHP